MNVQLINHSENIMKTIASAGKLCYSNKATINDLMDNLTEEEINKFVKQIISVNHASVLEHVSFTFAIEGVSRTLTHELVRHRIASYSQRSQRYVSEKGCEFVSPIFASKEQEEVYNKCIEYTHETYNKLIELGMKKEDARYVLPNATCTRIIFTMNLRSLLHFFNLRCCTRAQWEIRQMANEMLKICKNKFPVLFEKAGASCDTLGYCPEGNRCCGKKKPLEQILSDN